MSLVRTRPTPTGLFRLLGLSTNPSNSGFQRSHIMGAEFVGTDDTNNLQWLARILGPNGANERYNSVLLPEADRGSAILGTARHFSDHIDDFDDLFFDTSAQGLSNSNKFLNVLRRDLERDLSVLNFSLDDVDSPSAQNIAKQYRISVRNFLDFAKILFLHTENLDRIFDLETGELFPDLNAIALNDFDIRFDDNQSLAIYLGLLNASDLFDYRRLVGFPGIQGSGDPLFGRIVELRSMNGGDVDIDEVLVQFFPELSRIIYPNGRVVWATEQGAAYIDVHADILAREAILSGVIDNQEPREEVDYQEFEDLLGRNARTIVTNEIRRALSSMNPADRAQALTGNDLFDGLTDSNALLFAGSFDNVFDELRKAEIDAYRRANATLAQVLGERADYQDRFAITSDGKATALTLGLSSDIATRAALGAVLKTYATTKTIVAEGRYGTQTIDYLQWEAGELASGNPVLLPFDYDTDDEITVIVATTRTAGYYRMDGANDLDLDEIREKAFDIAGAAPLGSQTQLVATAVGAATLALEVTGRIVSNAISRHPIGRAVVLGGKLLDALQDNVWSYDIELVSGDGATVAMDGDDLLLGIEGAYLQASNQGNTLVHFGYGELKGGTDGDILIGIGPDSVADAAGALGARSNSDTLLLDGGDGNDWVIVLGGEDATTAGGLGRDWIFNTSSGGIIWGDFANGVDEDGNRAEDSSANSDNFWFFPDTVVMDAQRYDVLKFFGIPLTGGDAAASGVMLAVGGRAGGLLGAAGTIAAANAAAAASGNSVYYDNLVPFITYQLVGDDLFVGNVFDGFFRAVTGQGGIFSIDNSDESGWVISRLAANDGYEEFRDRGEAA